MQPEGPQAYPVTVRDVPTDWMMADKVAVEEDGSEPYSASPLHEYEQWLAVGVEKGWVSGPVCASHEGIPNTPAEQARWDEGGDPCEIVLRVWAGIDDWEDWGTEEAKELGVG